MTMVSTGEISIGGNATSGGLNRSVNIELGRSATATSSLNESALRTLAGVPTGAISLSSFYGKSNAFAFTISSNQTNANLRTLAVNAGWNQSTKVIATIASGVYCSSNSTGTPGLTINGSFPNGVDLINGGFIIGMGGAGGNGSWVQTNDTQVAGSNGSAGGLALSVSSAVSITNNGTIGGGGGGGGGGRGGRAGVESSGKDTFTAGVGGGGGGGGRSGAAANSSGGTSPLPTGYTYNNAGSPGGSGTSGGAGGGGAGGTRTVAYNITAGSGGSGGGWGSAGSSGTSGSTNTQLQFLWAGGPYSGGSAGGAVSGNSNVTWVATGTRLGSIT